MPKKVLLLGSYGQTNLGDDVLMWNYLALLHGRGYEVTVNASRAELVPEIVRQTYPEMRIIETYKTSLADWLRILRRTDAAVYGGGTIYKELYGTTGRFKHGVTLRMAALNILARMAGVKIYHFNIGIGSVKTRTGRLIAKIGLGAASYSIFRDKKSYEFARKKLKLPRERICESTDGLFLNQSWRKSWHDAALKIDRKKYKTVVGVNLLSDIPDWIDRRHYLATMRQMLQQMLDDGNFVLLIPFQHDFNPANDHAFMEKEIAPHLKGGGWRLLDKIEIDQITSVLAACDAIVGMRFHSLLLAAAAQVPFVALCYDTKCARFVEESNYTYAVKLEELTPAGLQDKLTGVLRNKQSVKKQLKAIADEQYRRAEGCLRDTQL